jgi:hypothetical protein
MTVWIRRNGKLIERSKAGPKEWTTAVISDTMTPLKHMGTGRMIDSKAKFRADTKASNCVEIGNEQPKPRPTIQLDRGQRREAIRKALYTLRNA